jgi:hypothetical protein
MSALGSKLTPQPETESALKKRGPLAHLLHALNQPLTGLQCSLELAAIARRTPDQYIRTLHDALELTERMRVLVETMREVLEAQSPIADSLQPVLLGSLLRDTVAELVPVAETRGIRVSLTCDKSLSIWGDRRCLAAVMFRLLESAMSLADEGSELRVDGTCVVRKVRIVVSWNQTSQPEYSPFSRPELGLLIAQAGWEQAGAEWTRSRTGNTQSCTIDLVPDSPIPSNQGDWRNMK